MRAIGTEYVIPLHKDEDGILAEHAAIVRVVDGGSGPFLEISGRDLNDPDDHSFFMQTAEEIEVFAAVLKRILEAAQ